MTNAHQYGQPSSLQVTRAKKIPERLLRREQHQRADDDDHADDVHRDAEVVEPRDQPDAEVIDQRMRQQDRRVHRSARARSSSASRASGVTNSAQP